jgi:hypothetical protein
LYAVASASQAAHSRLIMSAASEDQGARLVEVFELLIVASSMFGGGCAEHGWAFHNDASTIFVNLSCRLSGYVCPSIAKIP